MNVRPLAEDEVELVDAHLPLNRLDHYRRGNSTYLIAWDGDVPLGHGHLAWPEVPGEPPELQDVFVPEHARRRGVGSAVTRAAEAKAAARGFDRLSLTVGADNAAARKLYERLGYRDTGRDPERIQGTITIRGEPFEVDDTLLFLERRL
jgi:ribosomal protein S18 acetylase RimI-like enzyme